ncbi:hypothetical protein [Microvirga sp. M2]|uniref:hypothetical protein n=1 Tax=Microvirga sp. M2 TaxID=3073270 RepID=UPI0039C2AA69
MVVLVIRAGSDVGLNVLVVIILIDGLGQSDLGALPDCGLIERFRWASGTQTS